MTDQSDTVNAAPSDEPFQAAEEPTVEQVQPEEQPVRRPATGVTVILFVLGFFLYLSSVWLGLPVPLGERFSVTLVLFPLWAMLLVAALAWVFRMMREASQEWSGVKRFFIAAGCVAGFALLAPTSHGIDVAPAVATIVLALFTDAGQQLVFAPMLWFVIPALIVAEAWIRRGINFSASRSLSWAILVIGLGALALLPWAAQAMYLYGLTSKGL